MLNLLLLQPVSGRVNSTNPVTDSHTQSPDSLVVLAAVAPGLGSSTAGLWSTSPSFTELYEKSAQPYETNTERISTMGQYDSRSRSPGFSKRRRDDRYDPRAARPRSRSRDVRLIDLYTLFPA